MKKRQLLVLIVLGSLIGIYFLLFFTGLFAVFKNRTIVNEPSLSQGKILFSTNLVNPENGDFVVYKVRYPDSLFTEYRIHRLVGLENDIIEIKEGVLFVNGENFDKNLSLAHEYKVTVNELNKLDIDKEEIETNYWWMKPEDTLSWKIPDKIASELNLNERRVVSTRDELDEVILAMYNENWNKDNFGPYKIPPGKIFIMGDNRDLSEDSRFIGPIDKSAVKGVLID
ncbi:MAG: signal peptidase I [Bacteroidota bacterium]